MLSEILGTSVPLVCGEKQFLLSPITKSIQARYEVWLRSQVLAEIRKDGDEAMLLSAYEAIGIGRYNWGTAVCDKSLRTSKGTCYLFYLILSAEHPNITEDEANKIANEYPSECIAALTQAFGKKKQ